MLFAFASITMSCAITKGPHPSVKAMDKSTRIYEWIPISKETRKKFSRVGAPRRIPKPYYRRPQTKVFTPEEEMELLLNCDQNLDQLCQLADLFSKTK